MDLGGPTLTGQTEEVLRCAGEWAQSLNATQVEAEHLLLALVNEEHGVAALVLGASGIDLTKLLQLLAPQALLTANASTQQAVPSPSPAFRRACELAAQEANALEQSYIETGHLLLGLLAGADATTVGVLRSCGATADHVREETLLMLSAPEAPFSERSRIEKPKIEEGQVLGAQARTFSASKPAYTTALAVRAITSLVMVLVLIALAVVIVVLHITAGRASLFDALGLIVIAAIVLLVAKRFIDAHARSAESP